MRILFVDDDPVRHKAFSRNATGCVVDYAFNVNDAIHLCERNFYDVLFLDYDLSADGYVNGLPLVHELMRTQCQENALVVIHSLNPKDAHRLAEYTASVQRATIIWPGCWGVVDKAILESWLETLRRKVEA